MIDMSYLGSTTGEKKPLTNQAALMIAPFLPFDGMNSQGLAVDRMAVSHTEGGSEENPPARRLFYMNFQSPPPQVGNPAVGNFHTALQVELLKPRQLP